MKHVKQFLIILAVTFAGEALNYFIPFPIPAGIYGLVILFILLETKILKLEQIQDTADFFLGIMPLLFVPSSVGFINAFPILKKYGIQFVIIGLVTTALVMICTGLITQLVIKISKRNRKDKEEKPE